MIGKFTFASMGTLSIIWFVLGLQRTLDFSITMGNTEHVCVAISLFMVNQMLGHSSAGFYLLFSSTHTIGNERN